MQPFRYPLFAIFIIGVVYFVYQLYLFFRYPYHSSFGMTLDSSDRFEKLCINLNTSPTRTLESAALLYETFYTGRERKHRFFTKKGEIKTEFDPKLLGNLTLIIGPLRKQQFVFVKLHLTTDISDIVFDLQQRTGFHSPDSVVRCAISALEWVTKKRLDGHDIISQSADETINITEQVDQIMFPCEKLHLAHTK